MKTELVNGTVYECPYCHQDLTERNELHLFRVTLLCKTCKYYVSALTAKDAYACILKDGDMIREQMKKNNTDHKDCTTYECPYCHKQMKEDWSHFGEHKRVMLYCNGCRYGVFGDNPKDAYAYLMRKDETK